MELAPTASASVGAAGRLDSDLGFWSHRTDPHERWGHGTIWVGPHSPAVLAGSQRNLLCVPAKCPFPPTLGGLCCFLPLWTEIASVL